MKKYIATLVLTVLAASCFAVVPEAGQHLILRNANGKYLTTFESKAAFFLKDYKDAPSQTFSTGKADGDAFTLGAPNGMYMSSVHGQPAVGLSDGEYAGAHYRFEPCEDGLFAIINTALPADSCALLADGDSLYIGAPKGQWQVEIVKLFDVDLSQTTVYDHYADYKLPYDDPRADAYPGYKLVFAEEFDTDGAQPSKDIWKYEIGYRRNHEDQFYTDSPNNTWMENGVLVINGRREAEGEVPNPNYDPERAKRMAERFGKKHDGQQPPHRPRPNFNPRWMKPTLDWTSASIITDGNPEGGYSWLYGIYEVRAKVPTYSGMWPAIWSTGKEYGWPRGGEIDIMEWYRNMILGNVCWGDQQWNSKTVSMDILNGLQPNWGDFYHVWKMVWDFAHIELWCDNVLVNYIDLDTTYNPVREGEPWSGVNPFRDVRQGLWLNLALGGDNGGPLDNAPDDNYYLIDYARIYQKLGSDGKATYHVDPYRHDAYITAPTQNPRQK